MTASQHALFGFVVATVCFGPMGCGERQRQTGPASATINEQEFRSLVYTEGFRERFALPDEGVYELDPGLQAFALRILYTAGRGPTCWIDLYLDGSIELAMPAEDFHAWLGARDPFFFVRGFRGEDDRVTLGKLADYVDRFVFQSRHSTRSNPGVSVGGAPDVYMRDVLPGLDLLSRGLSCDYLNPKHGPSEVWLRRAGSKEKLDASAPTLAVAYRFSVPVPLISHAKEAILAASKAMDSQPLPWVTPYSIPPRDGEDN